MSNHENGTEPRERRQLGRRAPMPPLFTFPDSGVTIGLYRTSPETLQAIHRKIHKDNPPPPMPTRTVEIGESETPVQEADPHNPEYAQALWQHSVTTAKLIGEKLFILAIKQMVVTIDQEALAAFKETMAEIGIPLEDEGKPVSDRDLYIRHICITSDRDLNAMMDYLLSRSQPTEAAVEAHKEQFPDQVVG